MPRYDAIVVICDNEDDHQILLRGLDEWFSEIDAFGDGVILGAARMDAREIPLPHNVVAFGDDGDRVGSFYAGDGILQLLTDAGGRIWISYFDEASYGFAKPDGTLGVSYMPGLARWDGIGSDPWFAYSDTGNQVGWCDCYAVNVGRTLVYACPYVDFPLVEIDASGVRSITPNPITRCTGLAVSNSRFDFFDHYRQNDAPVWSIRKGLREGGVVTETGREILTLPGSRSPTGWARGKIGRDGTLWLHEDGNPRQWYRYEIDS
ncbi:hypothetical protein [Nocardia sp. NPDC052566]|uniref:hypothetical protein n=1 Tax=Nocardia sp. NPDC052566 TaxID=3364330 RepID=UPI0037C9C1AC